ncbi:hypothetical protein CLOP_g5071 [Closterium sp. NIES-67]|nr:hypothetical protein CLOP_g5071 [Closterium sp. NIES-67]
MLARVVLSLVLASTVLGLEVQASQEPLVLPLSYGHFAPSQRLSGVSPFRRKLSEARMWLYGNVLTQGYYYANVWFGTPPRRFALIVDTGSTVTYVPCATCKQCGSHHQDAPFVPRKSSTYEPVGCNADKCPTWECESESVCSYERHYAENSSSSGLIVSDMAWFGNTSNIPPTRVLFGCETSETGDIYSQQADGILGMGRGPLGLVTQLVERKAMREVFSLCYGGMDANGGAMIMGFTRPPPGMKFTSLSQGQGTYYNVELRSITVAGVPLQLDESVFRAGYGTVLDSGTTFAYLPPAAFNAFKKAMSEGVNGLRPVPGPDEAYDDVCFSGATEDLSELSNFFPPVALNLGGDVAYELSPENFLFRHTKVKGAYCLALFANADEGTLLGGIITRNTLVTYDRTRSRVGLWKTECAHLFSQLHALQGANAPPLADELAEQPPPLPDSAHLPHNASDGSDGSLFDECLDCASSLRVEMRVPLPLIDFAPLVPDFVHGMATALKLEDVQVSVDKFVEVRAASASSPAVTSVSLLILPLPPDDVLPAASLERVETLLRGTIKVNDVFGHVTVADVSVNLQRPQSNSPGWFEPLLPLLGGVVALVLVVGAVGVVWRRRQSMTRYGTVRQTAEGEDEEQGLAEAHEAEEGEEVEEELEGDDEHTGMVGPEGYRGDEGEAGAETTATHRDVD